MRRGGQRFLGKEANGRAHMVHLSQYSSSSFFPPFREEHVAAVCVRALRRRGSRRPSRMQPPSAPAPPPAPLPRRRRRRPSSFARSFSPRVVAGDHSPAKTRATSAPCIPSLISTERICRASTAFDERRNFSAGTDNMFREKYRRLRPRQISPCFGKKTRISFLLNKRELISNLFQSRKSIHYFFLPFSFLFTVTAPAFVNWRTKSRSEEKISIGNFILENGETRFLLFADSEWPRNIMSRNPRNSSTISNVSSFS